MYGSSNADDSQSHKYIHSSNNLMTGGEDHEKEVLRLLAKVAGNAAKRADGRASEFGMHQPKKPSKNSRSRMTKGERRSEEI